MNQYTEAHYEKIKERLEKREFQLGKQGQVMGDKILELERQMRNLTLDRDRWKRRANEMDAKLKSLGFSED